MIIIRPQSRKSNRTNEGDDRLKRQKRDRHTAKGDRDDRFAQMARKDPGEKAREWMRRPAYAPGELSFQARRLIRHQGRQMEHESVDQYVRRQELGKR